MHGTVSQLLEEGEVKLADKLRSAVFMLFIVVFLLIFPIIGIFSIGVKLLKKVAELYHLAELGTSLFEIALSLFALERTLILGAMALLETKSEAL